MYNVGFGDCFLLSFNYSAPVANPADAADRRDARHILFDFGSTSRARSRLTLKAVGDQIERDCGGRLDAIVMTHRHRDHLSGFGAASTQKIIRKLDPRLVVRPWTENPRLKATAGQVDGAAIAGHATADDLLLARLREGQEVAQRIVERSKTEQRMGSSDLVQLADDEVANAAAVTELDRLAAGRRGEYLSVKRETRLGTIVPGVSFRVLGPPRPRDWPAVAKQTEDSDEFWLAKDGQVKRLFATPAATDQGPLGTSRWIIERLRQDEQGQVAGLVRWLDDALNNTSVILLIEVGGHTLLFGGDAQIENWGWALRQAKRDSELGAALSKVDLYKVGHHGSRNATPISLYRMWESRRPTSPLLSIMSTKLGVHGEADHVVPRSTLVAALRKLGQVLSTDDGEADWIEVRARLPGGAYEVSQAAPR
jgi:hypothetical protein